jgi:hypothetical protein
VENGHTTSSTLTRPLLTRTEALAIALLLGLPMMSDAFSEAAVAGTHDNGNEIAASGDTAPAPGELFIG